MTLRFLTLNPGHFHAALVQKEMYDGVDRAVHVYAPLGLDLIAHLQRILGFNTRAQHPTAWQVEVHAGPDYLERFRREKPGDIAVIAGRNSTKIALIEAALDAGLHVLADKPWILTPADLPRLQGALNSAETKGLIAYDIMTERYEITSILQRELIQDEAIFGTIVSGSANEPGVYMESVHYVKKTVAGVPLRRPGWFFDVREQGEGLSDVGTHLVDLIPWMLFPEQPLDVGRDLRLLAAKRWPTVMSLSDFQQVTGESAFPGYLDSHVRGGKLEYFCNTQVEYQLRGIHVKLDVLWDYEAAPGAGDTHLAIFRGTKADIEIRQAKDENYRPELYVVPHADKAATRRALDARVSRLQQSYPGCTVEDQGRRFRINIPDLFRVGHEAHFGEVTKQFLRYVRKEEALPKWEKSNMLAKYWTTTGGVELAKR